MTFHIETLNKMGKSELLEICKKNGLKKYSSKKKSQLIDMIIESSYRANANASASEHHIQEQSSEGMGMAQTVEAKATLPVEPSGTHDLLHILNKLLEKYSIKSLSEILNLAPGTLGRWIELNDIPKSYEFDLLKLAGIQIDYSLYSSKQKDQFFTPPATAKYCFEVFRREIESFGETPEYFKYIEPSAGDGSFLTVLPPDFTIAMDIDPKHPDVVKQDYLEWKPVDIGSRYVVFGNPPFGLRGHQALKFINHSYEFAEYVCFILPQLFESDGKGVPRKRVKGFHLIYSEKIDTNFYEPDKKEVKINTIFQIWSKDHTNNEYEIREYANEKMRIYSMSDGGTVASTRNKNMIGNCDVYIPSTCFGKENMKCYSQFEDLPGKKGYGIVFYQDKTERMEKMLQTDWSNIAFLSTNSAYNLRSSQIYSLFENM
jgi:hypothetical protein